MNRERIYVAVLIGLLVLELVMAFELRSIRQEIAESMDNLSGNINKISIDTEGKLAAIDKKYERLAEIKSSAAQVTSAEYVAKTDRQDADVELKEEKPKITVKVNGGKKYSFDLLENEAAKFDKGKLVLEKSSSIDLNLVTDEYKKSRWSITTAANADKEALFGVSYRLGRSVSADIFVGQHIKPYFGLTWSVGARR